MKGGDGRRERRCVRTEGNAAVAGEEKGVERVLLTVERERRTLQRGVVVVEGRWWWRWWRWWVHGGGASGSRGDGWQLVEMAKKKEIWELVVW